MTPIKPAALGDTPERLLSITVEYRDAARTRCFVTIRPGEDITVQYESGSLFRYPAGDLDLEAFDRAVRNLAGIPYQENIGPLTAATRAAPKAGTGSSGRHA
jgi:hypothetical protein